LDVKIKQMENNKEERRLRHKMGSGKEKGGKGNILI
jgi:hypothetical protein